MLPALMLNFPVDAPLSLVEKCEAWAPVSEEPSASMMRMSGRRSSSSVLRAAVKIAPQYAESTVYVVDASRVVTVVSDWNVDNVIKVILEHAATGNIGDGKIFISDIEDAVRVRTGERGNDVL